MTPETQTTIFDSFTQADPSTTRKFGGTGLGLTICKQYIELMGGLIEVDSHVGAGTTITVRVPTKIKPKSASNLLSRELINPCFLLEADEDIAAMVTTHLESLGWNGSQIKRAEEADLPLANETNAIVFMALDPGLFDNVQTTAREIPARTIFYTFSSLDIARMSEVNHPLLSLPISQANLIECIECLDTNVTLPKQIENQQHQINQKAQKFLIAEDIDVNQMIIGGMLVALNCNFDVAKNGEEAVKLYESGVYDLIFMDCQMPVKDGHQATREIRHIQAKTCRAPIPIIALTAGGSENERLSCIESGMNDVLEKPFTKSDIEGIISKYIKPSIPRETLGTDSTLINDLSATMDESVISGLFEIQQQTGSEIISRVFLGYQQQMEKAIPDLQILCEADNLKALKSLAHSIKSMSANIGAVKVKEDAQQIEEALLAEDCQIEDLCVSLERNYLGFVAKFREHYLDVRALQ